MTVTNLMQAFEKGASVLIENETYFCELDAKTGDGDHGITIAKIGKAILSVTNKEKDITCSEFFYRIFDEIMAINGGSIAPLWALMADGAAIATEENEPSVKVILQGALKGLQEVSNAKRGEKTLLDPLYAAIDAVLLEKDTQKHLLYASDAAMKAAMDTVNMPAKFGRAKNLPDKGIGALDPGAVSLAYFIKGLKVD